MSGVLLFPHGFGWKTSGSVFRCFCEIINSPPFAEQYSQFRDFLGSDESAGQIVSLEDLDVPALRQLEKAVEEITYYVRDGQSTLEEGQYREGFLKEMTRLSKVIKETVEKTKSKGSNGSVR